MAKSQPGEFLKSMRALLLGKGLMEVPDCQLLEWFVAEHEEAAFQALMRRHGPMVLDVGRRVLGNHHDAEDVFQATFIILARNAKAIRKKQAVGGWLHGVAQRLAMKARTQAARRQTREKQAASMRRPNVEPAWTELNQDLDRALQGLPAKYREALVLCYLEGKTQEQAAKQLGCPLGTVQSRLAQGKKLLRDRLARRGFSLSVGAFTALLATSAAARAVPVELRHLTLKAALNIAAGKALGPGMVSAQVVALVNSGIKAMLAAKVKLMCATIVSVSLLGLGAGTLAHHLSDASGAANPTLRQLPPGAGNATSKVELAADNDLYGDPLPEGAVARLGTVRFRNGAPLTASAISPDGRLVAGGVSIRIQIWDAETGKTVQRISEARSGGSSALAFSADGKLLAGFGVRESRLSIFDVATGRLVKQFDVKRDDRGDPKQFELKPAPVGNFKVGALRIPGLSHVVSSCADS